MIADFCQYIRQILQAISGRRDNYYVTKIQNTQNKT